MRKFECLGLCLAAVCVFLLPQSLYSDSQYKYTLAQNIDLYFAHISYSEVRKDGNDPLVYREGVLKPESAVLNFPLGPGDTIRTADRGQCEIQFDTGTLVRLDVNTSLKIETVLAKSLSSGKKLTNLVLLDGHIYVMYKRYKRGEVFQILTPNTAIKLDHNSVGFVHAKEDGSTDVKIKEGKGRVMYGPDEKHLEKKKLKKHRTLSVSADDRIDHGAYEQDNGFELWNESMNEDFVAMHKGITAIPDPIYKYPKSVVYFAQKYSNHYGEWKWNSLYGYVWKPNFGKKYPGGDWQPYVHGSWTSFDNHLFWVPQEPWGWVPYHLGIWVWDKEIGWMWIPGDAFAPAWVTWEFFAGYYMWKPWSLYDWYYVSNSYRGYYGNPWAYYPGGNYAIPPGKKVPLKTIKKEQLQDDKKTGIPSRPPKPIRRAYSNYVKMLERNDPKLLASLKDIPDHIVVVKSRDINANRIQEKRLRVTDVPFEQFRERDPIGQGMDPYHSAYTTFHKNEVISAVEKRSFPVQPVLESRPFRGADTPTSPSIVKSRTFKAPALDAAKKGAIISDSNFRFRDWNPDVSYARRTGVEIRYSSRTNEVFCPELGISSRGVVTTSAGRINVRSSPSWNSFTKPSFSTSWSSDDTSVSDSSSSSERSSSSSKEVSVSTGTKKKN